MRRQFPSALLLAVLAATAARGESVGPAGAAAGGSPNAADSAARAGAVQGRVSTQGRAATEAAPLARATVYAYELAKLQIHKVVSGQQGDFRFEQLPAGVYKLIAFKVGYEPGVVMLSRAAAGALQYVDLRLALEQSRADKPAESFWAIRDQIPPDVLRDIEAVRLAEQVVGPATRVELPARGFRTNVHAMTGVQDVGAARALQLAGGGIGMEGRIGSMDVGVTGDFWRLDSAASTTMAATAAEATALEVRMAGSGEGLIDFTTVSHRGGPMRTRLGDVEGAADFERYRVSWMQPFGERSSSRFEAQYTSHNNFFAQPSLDGRNDTRALNVEGAYMLATERNSLETGVRYREQMTGHSLAGVEADRALELFGKAGLQMRPSVLVEYGMFTQLRDGSLALAPQGGVVVQLGAQWQALASGSYRIDSGDTRPLGGFTPLRFSQADGTCRDLEQHCYRVMLSRQGEDGQLLAIGGVHRELAETLHMYFEDDFLDRLEGLYLVQGDEVPELQLVVERRLAPRVLARLESSYGAGGGGILYAVGEQPFENRVRYLVTSLDTRFQASKTGVFVAFHQLEQGAEALATAGSTAESVPASELERLQLMLSQDLEVLARVAADWAVHVNFELTRGELPFSLRDPAADELRRQVTGGLSIKF